MMGCDTSKDNASITDESMLGQQVSSAKSRWPPHQDSINVVQEYIYLDEKCYKLESGCPGPRLATCEAWLEFLKTQRNSLLNIETTPETKKNDNNPNTSTSTSTSTNSSTTTETSHISRLSTGLVQDVGNLPVVSLHKRKKLETNHNNLISKGVQVPSSSMKRKKHITTTTTPTQDLVNMALSLGVVSDLNKAAQHEEFFAQLSENALHLITIRYYTEIMEHTETRLTTLRGSYNQLNTLYGQLDVIKVSINGGTYMSRFEENLDAELKTARDVRDKLGSTLEQWHICGLLLKASSQSASQSLKQWRKIKTIVNPTAKLEMALNSRKDLQASLVCLECAQSALPHVDIKYITTRQISAVKHCIIYIITDIVNLIRYEHTTKVFTAYDTYIGKAVLWFYETFNDTLREDFLRANDSVFNLMKTLRDYREEVYITNITSK